MLMLMLKLILLAVGCAASTAADGDSPVVKDLPWSSVITTTYDVQGQAVVFDDATNYAYVTSAEKHNVLEIDNEGNWKVFAGCSRADYVDDCPLQAACFSSPAGIRKLPSQQIWFVADYGNARVRLITTKGVTTLAGNGNKVHTDGYGTAASFIGPFALALDTVNRAVFVGDGFYISRIDLRDGHSQTFGTFQDEDYTDRYGSGFWGVVGGLTFDARHNYLYAAVTTENLIKRMNFNTAGLGSVEIFAGTGADSDNDGARLHASIRRPYGIASDSSTHQFYVTGYEGRRILKITCDPFDPSCAVDHSTGFGIVKTVAGGSGSGLVDSVDGAGSRAAFAAPMGLSISPPLGSIWVVDPPNTAIRRVVVQGVMQGVRQYGSGHSGQQQDSGDGVTISSGDVVVLLGRNLGSGHDIFQVLIQGHPAEIVAQTAAEVLVRAVGTRPGPGDIYVYSLTTGVTFVHYSHGSRKTAAAAKSS